jgi:hypothetical protein
MSKTASNATAVRTPGEEVKPDVDGAGAQAGDAQNQEGDGLGVGDGVSGETPKPAKKLTIEERMDMLEEENRQLRANQMPPKVAKVDPTADLPDISEYTGKNQHKQNDLTSAVLTKQGWIAPAHLGANPAALNELQKRGLAATSVT